MLRSGLDPAVEVMWTGAYVVPDEITVAHAEAARSTYGRPVFVWDNTPVNDFPAPPGDSSSPPTPGGSRDCRRTSAVSSSTP